MLAPSTSKLARAGSKWEHKVRLSKGIFLASVLEIQIPGRISCRPFIPNSEASSKTAHIATTRLEFALNNQVCRSASLKCGSVSSFSLYCGSGSSFSLKSGSESCSSSAMRIGDHWSTTDPPRLHFEPRILHRERPPPSAAPLWASKAPEFWLTLIWTRIKLLTIMQTRIQIQLFTPKRIRIQLPKLIRIRRSGSATLLA